MKNDMEKVKLRFTTDLGHSKLFGIYLNPDADKLRIAGSEIPSVWSAYGRLCYYFVFSKLPKKVSLINEKGKNITSKLKDSSDFWSNNRIPLSQRGIKELAKMKSGLFKKADPEQVRNVLFCHFPSPKDMAARYIIKFLEYCRQHLEDDNEDEVLDILLGFKNHDGGEVAMATDCFNNVKGLSMVAEFELEMEKNIDCDDLYFLSFRSPAKIFDSNRVIVPNVMVYKDELIFGNLHILYPEEMDMMHLDITMKKCSGKIKEVKKELDLQ